MNEHLIPEEELQKLIEQIDALKANINQVIIGQNETLELMLTGLLANGHMLLEGVPGIAKTLMAKLLAKSIDAKYSRIQFTPDLMPADVTGSSVFNPKTTEFSFNKGPIFAQLVLIDEVNRSPAKTQAALFEVMEEQQITVDGNTYILEYPFIVLATQNPIEQEGTYRLPEAQLDRFLFRIKLKYPSLTEETHILERFSMSNQNLLFEQIKPVLNIAQLRSLREWTERVHISPSLCAYIAQIVHATRNHPDLFLGASPRASLAIMRASKASAALKGRGFVTPEDIRAIAPSVLNHRIQLSPEKELEGSSPEEVIQQIVTSIEIPR